MHQIRVDKVVRVAHVLGPNDLRRRVVIHGSTIIISLNEVYATLKPVLVDLVIESIAILLSPQLLETSCGRAYTLFILKIHRACLASDMKVFQSRIGLTVFFIVS